MVSFNDFKTQYQSTITKRAMNVIENTLDNIVPEIDFCPRETEILKEYLVQDLRTAIDQTTNRWGKASVSNIASHLEYLATGDSSVLSYDPNTEYSGNSEEDSMYFREKEELLLLACEIERAGRTKKVK